MCGLDSYKEEWETKLRRYQSAQDKSTEQQTKPARLYSTINTVPQTSYTSDNYSDLTHTQ